MARPVRVVALIAAAAAGAVAVAWYFGLAREPAVTMDPRDARVVELGRQVYARECASCHGVDLEGQPNWRVRLPNGRMPAPPHDASGHTWHHGDKVLFDITKRGPAALCHRHAGLCRSAERPRNRRGHCLHQEHLAAGHSAPATAGQPLSGITSHPEEPDEVGRLEG
jgi:hypothetical protein